ncbi:putative hydrocephalus-inducing protein-like protein [Sesbania bispinosa]|nr:putative hydrocephalus-inducing protein-like protein [Sesbania bispinosa]
MSQPHNIVRGVVPPVVARLLSSSSKKLISWSDEYSGMMGLHFEWCMVHHRDVVTTTRRGKVEFYSQRQRGLECILEDDVIPGRATPW